MNFQCIIFEKRQGIATIKLNRPKVLNAMNKQLWLDIQSALVDAKNDPAIKVLVITGEGRAFSTGADLKESKTWTIEAYRDYLEELQVASRKIIRFESRLSPPSMGMLWVRDMNWPWHAISGSQPRRLRSALRRPRSPHPSPAEHSDWFRI